MNEIVKPDVNMQRKNREVALKYFKNLIKYFKRKITVCLGINNNKKKKNSSSSSILIKKEGGIDILIAMNRQNYVFNTKSDAKKQSTCQILKNSMNKTHTFKKYS